MNAQDLKNSILQLAIQGKLVEQRKEEGTGKELRDQIREEKEKLIKEGTIRKQKKLPKISEEEIPFDIPESWEWVRLKQITNITGGYAFKSSNYSEKGVRVIRISDFNERGFVNNKIVRHLYDSSLETYLLEKNNILLCMTGGTVGKSLFIEEINEPMMTNQRVATIKINPKISPEYVNYTVLSSVIQKIIKTSKNSTNDNISMNTIKEFLIPLPPLAEQKRIVTKIEELMPYVEKYDIAHSKVEVLNKKFPEDMQKSILQYAIQGKLVEQREEEGTAEELYKHIQEEKKKLIKEGKIKKTKKLAEITEEEIPFDIPESWKWVRLDSIVYNRGQLKPNEKFSYIDIGSIDNKNQKLNNDENVIDPNKAPSRARKIVGYDDILYSTVRPYLHNMCIINKEFTHQPIASTGFAVMTCYDGVLNKFLFYYLLSPSFDSYANSNENSKGVAYPAINDKRLYRVLVPLPPLKEQKRIAERIEELLPYAKQLVK